MKLSAFDFFSERVQNCVFQRGIDNDYTNRLLMALIDAVIADAEVRGANQEQLGDLIRKRSGIRKCFFHAVNCW